MLRSSIYDVQGLITTNFHSIWSFQYFHNNAIKSENHLCSIFWL